ncbi:MAG: hypothetical protein IPM29_18455 [Planctomycetes bacterium]|nr:hypothetical protein [Planctomycetota bacterium]
MNKRLLIGVGALVVLGAGAFVVQRELAAADRRARVERLLAEVDSELGQSTPRPDDLRRVLGNVRSEAASAPDDVALAVAEVRLLRKLGNPRRAWEAVQVRATAPGAPAELRGVAAEVLAEAVALTGDPGELRQALELAASRGRDSGDANALQLAWLLAFRVGDPEDFAALGAELRAQHAGTPDARLVEVLGHDLAALLGARLGIGVEELKASAPDPRARALGVLLESLGERPSLAAVDDLATALGDGAPPEFDLVRAFRRIERIGAERGEAAQIALFDALDDVEAVLEREPSSVDARDIAVLALIGLWSSPRGLEPDERTQLKAYLDWLLRNAGDTHARASVWREMRSRIDG